MKQFKIGDKVNEMKQTKYIDSYKNLRDSSARLRAASPTTLARL
jgi:hypothetical protein